MSHKLAAHLAESKPVAAIAGWLVEVAADRQTGEMTVKKRPGAAMPNDVDIAVRVFRKELLDRTDDARLRGDRGLPAAYAGLG
jgi:hypothetical protein